MVAYLTRRIFQTLIFLVLASLLLYTVLVMFMPDGPAYTYAKLKENINYADNHRLPVDLASAVNPITSLEQTYKLDKPWPLNYMAWLFDPSDTSAVAYDLEGNRYIRSKGVDLDIFGWHLRGSGMLTGDFGVSVGFATNEPISNLLSTRWARTALLLGTALLLALAVGVPMGIMSATRRGKRLDHVFTVFSLAGLSLPPYVLGLLLIVTLAILPATLRDQNGWGWLPLLPPGGAGDESVQSFLWHLILPAVTLALPQIAWISRQTRLAMLEVLRQDYIRTAWAKGLKSRRVVLRHALRNALIPVITQGALLVPTLMSWAAVVETVFAYQGLGQALFRSVGGCLWADVNRTQEPPPCPREGYFPMDYPFALTILLIMLAVVAVANIVADVLYVVADPRINYKEGAADL